jgi:hypothetical protein
MKNSKISMSVALSTALAGAAGTAWRCARYDQHRRPHRKLQGGGLREHAGNL